MDATVSLQFGLIKGQSIPGPRLRTRRAEPASGEWFAAAASDANLYEASRLALRGILDYLEAEHALTRTEACLLASVCVDLRISQIVNAATFTVTAFLPLAIFTA